METLLDIFERAVDRYADRVALAMDGESAGVPDLAWTFRELRQRSRVAAWRLRALGLEPGDRLLTW
jgi:non-ribosomal peptide synthetase component E (peptide arylation enzyme)